MKRFKLKERNGFFDICWLCISLFFLGLRVCVADNNLDNSNLREIQTNLARLDIAHLYGIQSERIVAMPLADIKSILENPPNIKDAVFGVYSITGTNYYRCGFATNGYCLGVGNDYSDLATLSALGDVMGRFGVTNWHASGSGIIFDDGTSHSEDVLGRDRSFLAYIPLQLGILPLLVGSVRFQDDRQFEATDSIGGNIGGNTIKGRLITDTEQNVSGIEYEVKGFTGWSYIVLFLSNSQDNTNKSTFQPHRFASFSIGPAQTNLMCITEISSIEVTKDALADNYFHPSQWLSHKSGIPVANEYIVKNQIMVDVDGRLVLVSATPEINAKHIEKIRIFRAVFILLAIIPVLLAAWHLKRKKQI